MASHHNGVSLNLSLIHKTFSVSVILGAVIALRVAESILSFTVILVPDVKNGPGKLTEDRCFE